MLSVIVPFFPGRNLEHVPMLHECLSTLTGHDEVLVMANEPTPDGRAQFSRYVNLGLRLARGDFRLVLNSDTKLLAGTLRDLCVPGVITTPVINGEAPPFHGCAFCVPRTVLEKHGGLDEGFIGNWEDLDFALRMYRAGVPMESVTTVSLWHQGGATYQHLNQMEMMHGENERRFLERWGKPYILSTLMGDDRANGRFVEPKPVL